mmetsp:Transcript_18042/g.29549  ORF Transcript_18042/g.29549 Transcript_18042/m.29549 type:complete len:219 (-) Transcript_18042:293-949(-)
MHSPSAHNQLPHSQLDYKQLPLPTPTTTNHHHPKSTSSSVEAGQAGEPPRPSARVYPTPSPPPNQPTLATINLPTLPSLMPYPILPVPHPIYQQQVNQLRREQEDFGKIIPTLTNCVLNWVLTKRTCLLPLRIRAFIVRMGWRLRHLCLVRLLLKVYWVMFLWWATSLRMRSVVVVRRRKRRFLCCLHHLVKSSLPFHTLNDSRLPIVLQWWDCYWPR